MAEREVTDPFLQEICDMLKCEADEVSLKTEWDYPSSFEMTRTVGDKRLVLRVDRENRGCVNMYIEAYPTPITANTSQPEWHFCE